jgi:low temperature requirement protein LtrA
MKWLVLKIVAAVLTAAISMVLLHFIVVWVTGRVAGPFATDVIWAVAMCVGLVVPVRLVMAYARDRPTDSGGSSTTE